MGDLLNKSLCVDIFVGFHVAVSWYAESHKSADMADEVRLSRNPTRQYQRVHKQQISLVALKFCRAGQHTCIKVNTPEHCMWGSLERFTRVELFIFLLKVSTTLYKILTWK